MHICPKLFDIGININTFTITESLQPSQRLISIFQKSMAMPFIIFDFSFYMFTFIKPSFL